MIEQQINQKLSEIQLKASELDNLKTLFIKATVPFFEKKVNEVVEESITIFSEKVIALGVSNLKPIKDQVNKIIANSEDYVYTGLDRKELWKHTQEGINRDNLSLEEYGYSMEGGGGGPKILNEAVRTLLSPIGVVLLENGLAGGNYWSKQIDGQLMYSSSLSWTAEMGQPMQQFNLKFREFYSLHEALYYLKQQKTRNEALNLWRGI